MDLNAATSKRFGRCGVLFALCFVFLCLGLCQTLVQRVDEYFFQESAPRISLLVNREDERKAESALDGVTIECGALLAKVSARGSSAADGEHSSLTVCHVTGFAPPLSTYTVARRLIEQEVLVLGYYLPERVYFGIPNFHRFIHDVALLSLSILVALAVGWAPQRELHAFRTKDIALRSVLFILLPLIASSAAIILSTVITEAVAATAHVTFGRVSTNHSLTLEDLGLFTDSMLVRFISSVGIAPVAEELLFRISLLGLFCRIANPFVSNVFVSLLFTWLHGYEAAGSLNVFFVSLALGIAFIRTRSLIVCSAGHILVNFRAFI